MNLQEAYRARLLANATLAGLVTKIAWGGLPQKTLLPYLRLAKAGAGRAWTHSGPDATVSPRVQIDIYAANERDLIPITEALQAEMERLDRTTAGGWTFYPPGLIENDIWPGAEDMTGGGTAYRAIHEYTLWAAPA